MNSSVLIVNGVRFLALLLLQVLVFQRISNGFSQLNFNYISIFIYPVFIMLLPVNLPHWISIAVSFTFGICIDWFYNSLGVHAGACVFTAFLRPFWLGLLEPRGGYPLSGGPTLHSLGVTWFIRYSTLFTLIHLFIYFSIQYFSFYYIFDILLSTISSFVISMLFIVMYQFLLNPKD